MLTINDLMNNAGMGKEMSSLWSMEALNKYCRRYGTYIKDEFFNKDRVRHSLMKVDGELVQIKMLNGEVMEMTLIRHLF